MRVEDQAYGFDNYRIQSKRIIFPEAECKAGLLNCERTKLNIGYMFYFVKGESRVRWVCLLAHRFSL